MTDDIRQANDLLQEITNAVHNAPYRRFTVDYAFGMGLCVRVEIKDVGARWSQVGPLLFPGPNQTVTEVLTMLGHMIEGKALGVSS